MKDLEKLRQEIDRIDDQIVELIADRFRHTGEIGLIKAQDDLPRLDPDRERQIISRLEEKSRSLALNPELIATIFRSILAEAVFRHNELSGK